MRRCEREYLEVSEEMNDRFQFIPLRITQMIGRVVGECQVNQIEYSADCIDWDRSTNRQWKYCYCYFPHFLVLFIDFLNRISKVVRLARATWWFFSSKAVSFSQCFLSTIPFLLLNPCSIISNFLISPWISELAFKWCFN